MLQAADAQSDTRLRAERVVTAARAGCDLTVVHGACSWM